MPRHYLQDLESASYAELVAMLDLMKVGIRFTKDQFEAKERILDEIRSRFRQLD